MAIGLGLSLAVLSPGAVVAGSLEARVAELRGVLRALEANRQQQDKAWPTREEDQAREAATPPPVLELEDVQRKLEVRKELVQAKIRAEASEDPDGFLVVLREAKEAGLAEALLPIATELGNEDPRVASELVRLAQRLKPCPMPVFLALAELESEEASAFLLEVGRRGKRMDLLRAAVKSGRPSALSRLIELAEGRDAELRKAALDALVRSTPPPLSRVRRQELVAARLEEMRTLDPELKASATFGAPQFDPELQTLVATRIGQVQLQELKAALVVYLGLCKNPSYASFFEAVYRTAVEDRNQTVRLAAIGALGNLGSDGGKLLVAELRNGKNPLAVRRACVHALAGAGYRACVPDLIDLLVDRSLRGDAARALRRIAGQDLGDARANWLTWWRGQPDAERVVRDDPYE